MKQQHPVIERYMTHLETAIGGLDSADRREVLQEIRNHIAEATAAGKSLDVVLESLGPADALGRAYAVELLLHPQNDRPRHAAERWLRLVGLVVVFSIPTLVAVSTLASVGISFVAGGLFAFVIGVLEALGVRPSNRRHGHETFCCAGALSVTVLGDGRVGVPCVPERQGRRLLPLRRRGDTA